MENDPLKGIVKRIYRHWYEDGVWEIGVAPVYLILGIFYLVVAYAPPNSWLHSLIVLLQIGVIFAAVFLLSHIVRFLKTHVTYPRSGYIEFRRRTRQSRLKRALIAFLLAVVIGQIVGAVTALPWAQTMIPLIVSMVMAVILLVLGFRFGLLRMFVNAALSILLGYGLAFYTTDAELGSGLFFVGFGLLMLVTGGLSMYRYLRRTTPAGAEDDYEAPPSGGNHPQQAGARRE